MLKNALEQREHQWSQLGTFDPVLSFVVRNGRSYQRAEWKYGFGEAKQCYKNAADIILKRNRRYKYQYAEGYACRANGLIFQHAWLTDGKSALDPTIPNNEGMEYFGVSFDRVALSQEIARTKVYSLFDTGIGINLDLMFRMDLGFRQYVEEANTSFIRKLMG